MYHLGKMHKDGATIRTHTVTPGLYEGYEGLCRQYSYMEHDRSQEIAWAHQHCHVQWGKWIISVCIACYRTFIYVPTQLLTFA
jgi:hypothetical protein